MSPTKTTDNATSVNEKTVTSVNINPQFELDGFGVDNIPSTKFINYFESLTQQSPAAEKESKSIFPFEVLPLPVQKIITATCENLNYPIDFTGASMLYAVSVAIGNTYRVELMRGWSENAVLYLAIVGRPGTNKSHPLSFALKPIEEQDAQTFRQYEQQKKEYDAVVSLTKKEREQQGVDEPVKPVCKQYLVTDFTPEALTDIHKFNKRGIGVYTDELAGWFKNFNRYNKGSEEQFWLSVFSGKPIRVSRKTSDPTYIPLPHISVAGTIQNGLLNELAKDNRTENGFTDRLLFVFPDNLKRKYWNETDIDPILIENWSSIISSLLNLSFQCDDAQDPKPEILRFNPNAKELLYKWQRENTDLCNKPENELISGIYAKAEIYAIRFSLILQLLQYACGEDDKTEISIEAVHGALKLVEYFKNSAIKVHSIVSNTSPLDKLPIDKQSLYNALPDYFTTHEGIKVAEGLGMAERTFKYFISSRDLFRNTKRGEYEKRF